MSSAHLLLVVLLACNGVTSMLRLCAPTPRTMLACGTACLMLRTASGPACLHSCAGTIRLPHTAHQAPARRGLEMRETSRRLHALNVLVAAIGGATYWLMHARAAWVLHDRHASWLHPLRSGMHAAAFMTLLEMMHRLSRPRRGRTQYMCWLVFSFVLCSTLAQLPLRWPHKAYWQALGVAPLPEITWSLLRIIACTEQGLPQGNRALQGAVHFIKGLTILLAQTFLGLPVFACSGALSPLAVERITVLADALVLVLLPNAVIEAEAMLALELRDYRKRAAEKARNYAEIKALMLSLERKNRFMSVMTHELRTPLHGIIAMAEAVTAKDQETLQVRRRCARAARRAWARAAEAGDAVARACRCRSRWRTPCRPSS